MSDVKKCDHGYVPGTVSSVFGVERVMYQPPTTIQALERALVPLREYEDVHDKQAACLGNVVIMLAALLGAAQALDG